MYLMKKMDEEGLYWNEIQNSWTTKNNASVYSCEDDAFSNNADDFVKNLVFPIASLYPVSIDSEHLDKRVVGKDHEDEFDGHCDPECPYLVSSASSEYIDGKCRLLNRYIPWYDYHIAICDMTNN